MTGVRRQRAAHLEMGAAKDREQAVPRGAQQVQRPGREGDERPRARQPPMYERMAARSASRSGAARRVVGSAKADILSGLPASLSVPPLPSGTSTSMLRAATCGWASACSTLLIGPAGISALVITV